MLNGGCGGGPIDRKKTIAVKLIFMDKSKTEKTVKYVGQKKTKKFLNN